MINVCCDAPIANDISVCGDCENTITIDLSTSVNPNGGILDCTTANITASNITGSYTISGCTLIYTPAPGISVTDVLQYTIANSCNPTGPSNVGNITIEVVCAGTANNVTLCD